MKTYNRLNHLIVFNENEPSEIRVSFKNEYSGYINGCKFTAKGSVIEVNGPREFIEYIQSAKLKFYEANVNFQGFDHGEIFGRKFRATFSSFEILTSSGRWVSQKNNTFIHAIKQVSRQRVRDRWMLSGYAGKPIQTGRKKVKAVTETEAMASLFPA